MDQLLPKKLNKYGLVKPYSRLKMAYESHAAQRYFHAYLSIDVTTSTNKIQTKIKSYFEASLSLKVY